jgi:hypothetical protein
MDETTRSRGPGFERLQRDLAAMVEVVCDFVRHRVASR